MIDTLLVFKTSGLLLHKRCYSNKQIGQDEELISGFFSALFSFIEQLNQFGLIEKIQTTDRIILIRKVQTIYIGIIISRFNIRIKNMEKFNIKEEIWSANRQLEEIGENLIFNLSRLITTHMIKSQMLYQDNCITPNLLSKIEKNIDNLVEINNSKLIMIKKVLSDSKNVNNKLKEENNEKIINLS